MAWNVLPSMLEMLTRGHRMLPGEYLGPRGHVSRTVGFLPLPFREKSDPKQGSCLDPFKAGAWIAGLFCSPDRVGTDRGPLWQLSGVVVLCPTVGLSGGPFLPAYPGAETTCCGQVERAVRGERRPSSKLLNPGKLHIPQMRALLWV